MSDALEVVVTDDQAVRRFRRMQRTFNEGDRGKRERHEAQEVIHCAICQAAYVPSQEYAYLWQGPVPALESALMSMCHFCFRCRRPSCPQCWDDVHGVCGECAQEADLPFRVVSRALSGAVYAPVCQVQSVRRADEIAPLVCVRHGRFQKETLSLADIPTNPAPARQRLERRQQGRQSMATEVPTKDTDVKAVETAQPESSQQTSQEEVAEIATRPEQQTEQAEGALSNDRSKRGIWIERVLVVLLAIILLVVIVLIVLALAFEQANTAIAEILHVDIRAEIAYLLKLLHDFHF
ncbi:MAG: hypothetical protein IMW89_17235 [Ktedonobacteraceae bacterium]|nr:hypothetical protein [Ktedonobacteraceae bacterium]